MAWLFANFHSIRKGPNFLLEARLPLGGSGIIHFNSTLVKKEEQMTLLKGSGLPTA